MWKKLLLSAAFVLALTAPALSSNCPNLIQEIDAALESSDLSDEDKAKVVELRNKGQEEHDAGQHDESIATLEEAKGMLGM